MAFCWAHLTGQWRHRYEKTIRLKKHGRPQYSLFRYGLDWIMTALMQQGQALRQLLKVSFVCFDPILMAKSLWR